MLERELHDFDRDEHAEDIFERTNELWKEDWVERVVH